MKKNLSFASSFVMGANAICGSVYLLKDRSVCLSDIKYYIIPNSKRVYSVD